MANQLEYVVQCTLLPTVKLIKSIFLTRSDFAQAVVKSFSHGKARIEQWCCAEERHKSNGIYYHLAIKLTQNQRWLTSKKYLMGNYGVSVHYSSVHHNYYSAWKYVTKSDEDYVQSDEHPRSFTRRCELTQNVKRQPSKMQEESKTTSAIFRGSRKHA